MFSNPIASYQQVSLESDIRGADPHRLIVLLFDGAESALATALVQMAAGDDHGKSISLTKASSIILEGLAASLNLQEGGELAQNLQALYQYMASRLVHANIRKDASAIREVQGLLGEISGAWREMGENMRQTTSGGKNP